MIIRAFPFFKDATVAGESDKWLNTMCSAGSIEIKGTATSFSLEIQGAVDDEDPNNIEWATLCVINANDLSTVNNITSKGIYSVDVSGKSIRVKINSISGGNLTIVGKFSD